MKAEPVTVVTILLLAAATAKDPIAFVCAGALAGACVVAIMAPNLTPAQRLIRALISLVTGITFAIGLFAVLGLWGHMSIDLATLQKLNNLRVDVMVGYVMAAVAFTFALLGYPVCSTIEKSAPRILGRAVNERFVPSRRDSRADRETRGEHNE